MSFAFAAATVTSVYAHGYCGTMQAVESWIQNKGKITTAATATPGSCEVEDYYDSVYSKTTTHFQIFYVLNGPHATTKNFVDSLAVNLEKAWDLHVVKNKMRTPKGRDTTVHYQKAVKQGLYGVEVLEINLVRNPRTVHGKTGLCEECFAVTNFAGRSNWQTSELMIDNDFKTIDIYKAEYDTLDVHGKKCSYWKSTKALRNTSEKYSYVVFYLDLSNSEDKKIGQTVVTPNSNILYDKEYFSNIRLIIMAYAFLSVISVLLYDSQLYFHLIASASPLTSKAKNLLGSKRQRKRCERTFSLFGSFSRQTRDDDATVAAQGDVAVVHHLAYHVYFSIHCLLRN